MMHRTRLRQLLIDLAVLALLAAATALVLGCAHRPAVWRGVAYGATAADVSITYAAIHTGRYREANPVYGDSPSLERLTLIASAQLGATEGLCTAVDPDGVWPEMRSLIWGVTAAGRALAVAWNLYQLESGGDLTVAVSIPIGD